MAQKKSKKGEQVRAQPCITNQPIFNIMFSHAHLRRAVRRTGASLSGNCTSSCKSSGTSSCKSRPSRGQRRTWKRREARTQGHQSLNTPPPLYRCARVSVCDLYVGLCRLAGFREAIPMCLCFLLAVGSLDLLKTSKLLGALFAVLGRAVGYSRGWIAFLNVCLCIMCIPWRTKRLRRLQLCRT